MPSRSALTTISSPSRVQASSAIYVGAPAPPRAAPACSARNSRVRLHGVDGHGGMGNALRVGPPPGQVVEARLVLEMRVRGV